MAKFHFVEDYQNLVRSLMQQHPLPEAMSLAVGGNWEGTGLACANLLMSCGLKDGMTVLDFGCGSGRVASALSKKLELSNFVGVDVVPELLQYAASICPKNYRFFVNHSLELPIPDQVFDFAYAFSVFTHLLQTEIGIYSIGIMQKLKPNGIFVFSFLEMDRHWKTFQDSMLAHLQHGQPYPHLNIFLSRDQIVTIAQQLGFEVEKWVDPDDPIHGIGQSVVVLRKKI